MGLTTNERLRIDNGGYMVLADTSPEALLDIGAEAFLPLLRQLRSNTESILYWTQKTLEESKLHPLRYASYTTLLEDTPPKDWE